MDTPSTLAAIIDLAAQRHNGASGRRLAELAQADGYTLSHATINRLRRGDAGSVAQATIDALAHLARVDTSVVIRAAHLAASGREPAAIARDYSRVSAELLRLAVEYATARDIDVDQARDELSGSATSAAASTTKGVKDQASQEQKTLDETKAAIRNAAGSVQDPRRHKRGQGA